MKPAVLFPGQGSQFIGMGKEFVLSDSDCEEVMRVAEGVCDFDIRQITFNGPLEQLTRAAVLQPAITVTNLICLRALTEKLEGKMEIAGFAGHSLGEYSALCGAGVISIEDAIRLVERRGYYMEREGLKNPGGMRAILGLGIEEIQAAVDSYSGPGAVTVANYNTPQQIVISGSSDGLDHVSVNAENNGGKVVPLNVSVANHSPLVADAVPDFSDFMETVRFNTPKTPVYFNVSAAVESDPAAIKSMMARQIASQVRWYEIITKMLDSGIDTFIEAGPKNVLKGMMKRIVPKGVKVVSLQFDTPEGLEGCLEKLGIS